MKSEGTLTEIRQSIFQRKALQHNRKRSWAIKIAEMEFVDNFTNETEWRDKHVLRTLFHS